MRVTSALFLVVCCAAFSACSGGAGVSPVVSVGIGSGGGGVGVGTRIDAYPGVPSPAAGSPDAAPLTTAHPALAVPPEASLGNAALLWLRQSAEVADLVTLNSLLELSPSALPKEWTNARTGLTYTAVAEPVFPDGPLPCRPFRLTLPARGEHPQTRIDAEACRQPNGQWRLVRAR